MLTSVQSGITTMLYEFDLYFLFIYKLSLETEEKINIEI